MVKHRCGKPVKVAKHRCTKICGGKAVRVPCPENMKVHGKKHRKTHRKVGRKVAKRSPCSCFKRAEAAERKALKKCK